MRITNGPSWSFITTMGDWIIVQWEDSGRNCAYLRKGVVLKHNIPHDDGNDLFTDDGEAWSWVAGWAIEELRRSSNPLVNRDLAELAKDLAKLKFNVSRTDESIHFL
jgi:hypothetical protein